MQTFEEMETELNDLAAELVSGLYSCGRVWEAWQYGTMTQNDFADAGNDPDITGDIARRLYDLIRAHYPQEN